MLQEQMEQAALLLVAQVDVFSPVLAALQLVAGSALGAALVVREDLAPLHLAQAGRAVL